MQRGPSKNRDALPATPIVLVVDDDQEVREGLSSLFRSVGLDPKLFASAAELLQHKLPEAPCCLVLDIRLPGVSGLDFQTQLAKANIHVPVIMMTGHGDIPMSVRAMKAGAVDFLTKPFRDQDMLDAVAQAIERDRKRRESEKARAELQGRYESMTPREREIMALVATGLMNKQSRSIGVTL
jgi:FixJ family two-component response regulator